MDTKDEIALIRKTIKAHCKTLSVVNGRGTAWGWVDIWALDPQDKRLSRDFTPAERDALKQLGFDFLGGNHMGISPQERRDWAKRLTNDPQAKFKLIRGDWD